MQLQRDDATFNAAIAKFKAAGHLAQQMADLQNVAIINFEENSFEEGDVFQLPATFENNVYMEVFENLPKTKKDEYPKGYYIPVWVENNKTGFKGVKKFRPNSADAVQPEYAFDAANATYKATGKRFGATPQNSTLAAAVLGSTTLYDKIDKLLKNAAGKNVRCTAKIAVDCAIREGGSRVVTGIQSRSIPIFNFEAI